MLDKKPEKTPKKWMKRQSINLVIIIALVIGNALTLAYILKRQKMISTQEIHTINFLQSVAFQKELAMLREQLALTRDRLAEKTKLLTQTQEALQQTQMQISKKPSEWMLMQADYLIELAAFNLMYQNNVSLARQLLQAANRTIQPLDGAFILPLRQALIDDIEMLRTSPTLDIPNVMGHINTVSQQVEQLPNTITASDEKTLLPTSKTGNTSHTLADRLNEFLLSLKNVFMDTVIVKNDNALPLLNINQYTFIVTDIQSQLSLSSWAVINQNPVVYHQSLEKIEALVQRYFPSDSPVVKQILKNLQDLQAVTINPNAPDIRRSLKAMQEAKH